MAIPFSVISRIAWEFQVLHILTKTWCCQILWFLDISTNVLWHLIIIKQHFFLPMVKWCKRIKPIRSQCNVSWCSGLHSYYCYLNKKSKVNLCPDYFWFRLSETFENQLGFQESGGTSCSLQYYRDIASALWNAVSVVDDYSFSFPPCFVFIAITQSCFIDCIFFFFFKASYSCFTTSPF